MAPWALAALVCLLLAVGLLLADDYGSSWDERSNFRAGRDALGTYLSEQHYLSYLHNGRDTLAHHGPSYFMAYWLVSRGLEAAVPGWDLAAARHFTNYLTFLLAIGCMYVLGRKLLPGRLAWTLPALFATQPLLFGHAFINQKDMPFLAFFLACVTAGVAFVDWLRSKERSGEAPGSVVGLMDTLRADWREGRWTARALLVAVVVLPLLVFLDFFWGMHLLAYLHSIVAQAYAGEAWAPITNAFRLVAEDSFKTSVAEYQFKVTWAFWIGRMVFMLLLGVVAVWLAGKAMPRSARWVSARYRRMILLMVLQGLLLGFTISIRPIGAFAGVLLIVYWVLRIRWQKLGLFLPYLAAASVATYLTWPYLWQDPFGGLWRSIRYSADFGSLLVLFRGNHITSDQLPWDYFPTLSALQLTVPAVVLLLAGLPLVAWRLARRDDRSQVMIVLLIWLGVPLAALMLLGVGIYNGIRQMLFLLPPMIAFAGLALGTILERVRPALARGAIVLLIILPGLLGIGRMHPYEYAYFNEFTGGPGGAAGKYEVDYWCTSLRETMEFVNAQSEPEAVVVAWGPYWAAEEYARPDLKIRPSSTRPPAYLLTCSWGLEKPPQAGEFTKLYDVRRGSAILGSVFKHLPQ